MRGSLSTRRRAGDCPPYLHGACSYSRDSWLRFSSSRENPSREGPPPARSNPKEIVGRDFMGAVCILAPVVIAAWPAFSAAVVAAASSLGYQVAAEAARPARAAK